MTARDKAGAEISEFVAPLPSLDDGGLGSNGHKSGFFTLIEGCSVMRYLAPYGCQSVEAVDACTCLFRDVATQFPRSAIAVLDKWLMK